MGEVEVKGVDSLAFLQRVVTNDVSTLKVGGAQYTAMCYENGGTVDDLLIYKRGEEDYLLVINTSNNGVRCNVIMLSPPYALTNQ